MENVNSGRELWNLKNDVTQAFFDKFRLLEMVNPPFEENKRTINKSGLDYGVKILNEHNQRVALLTDKLHQVCPDINTAKGVLEEMGESKDEKARFLTWWAMSQKENSKEEDL